MEEELPLERIPKQEPALPMQEAKCPVCGYPMYVEQRKEGQVWRCRCPEGTWG